MNNYFGIGIDAKISLDFHHKREEHPEKCRSRTRNYMWYGVLGSKQWYQVRLSRIKCSSIRPDWMLPDTRGVKFSFFYLISSVPSNHLLPLK